MTTKSVIPFEPLFRNPHLATIAGNFWTRPQSEARWPTFVKIYETAPGVQVLVHTQQPHNLPRGHVVLVHGLEGSSESGYALSMSHRLLDLGYAAHRFNLRGCGASEHLAPTSYHAGQTSDLLAVLKELRAAGSAPIFLVGFSLGGNVSLKLAGELEESARDLLAGICAVSTPIDLAACAAALGTAQNYIYENRFLVRLKDRIRRRHQLAPDIYTLEHLPKIHGIEDFDEYYTSKLFGFGTAANYFRTQSSNQFLERIRVPTLLVQAKDDPLIPFRVFDHPAFRTNPHLELLALEHGGHLGFLSRHNPRFWLDVVVGDWIEARNRTGGA